VDDVLVEIQMNDLDGLPVSRGTAPRLRMLCFRGLIDINALTPQRGIPSRMAL